MRLILVAPPGAGKSEQAKRLVREFNLTYISTGSIFRNHFATHDRFGTYTKAQFNSGILCDDDTTNKLVEQSLPEDNYLLDGYPRTLPQGRFFQASMTKRDLVYRVVFLSVPESVSMGRLLKRKGIEGRADDADAVIRNRFKVYKEQTSPLIPFYKKLGILIEQKGTGELEQIFKELKAKIERAYKI